MKFVESINSTQVYCSQKKSTLTAKKKKKKDAFTACNYIVGSMPKTQTLKCSKCRNQMGT